MLEQKEASTTAEVDRIAEDVKNWGRWGAEDERGALNLITEQKAATAAGLVRDGHTVSCALSLPVTPAPDNPTPVRHHMIRGGDAQDPDSRFGGSSDYFAIGPHGMATTHLDALCHMFVDGKMYNGFDMREVRSDGAERNSIMAAQDGVVSRGVLLDIPRLRGTEWLEPRERIAVDELVGAEDQQGVRVEEGDVLLVSTGRDARREAKGPWASRDGIAGLDASCIPWLHERGVAVLGCDGISDASPSGVNGWPMPFHQIVIVSMGVHLIDNMQLGRLMAACAERKRWEFLFAIAPLRLERGTASPINPLAIL